jgi:hypothetical protein
MTLIIFLFGTIYLALGFAVFVLTTLSSVPGVGSGNKYLDKVQSWTVNNKLLTLVSVGVGVALWPLHLAAVYAFKK